MSSRDAAFRVPTSNSFATVPSNLVNSCNQPRFPRKVAVCRDSFSVKKSLRRRPSAVRSRCNVVNVIFSGKTSHLNKRFFLHLLDPYYYDFRRHCGSCCRPTRSQSFVDGFCSSHFTFRNLFFFVKIARCSVLAQNVPTLWESKGGPR